MKFFDLLRMSINNRIIGAYKRTILSAFRFAQVFGTISPTSNTTMVRIPVANPVIRLCVLGVLKLIAIVVANAEAERFTMLFPIRIVLINLP